MKLMGLYRRYLCTASTSAGVSGGRSGGGEGGGAASASIPASEGSEAKSPSGANSGDGGKSQGSGDAGKPVRGSPVSWMSFFLLLATGAGIVYYYDKEKKRHIEGSFVCPFPFLTTSVPPFDIPSESFTHVLAIPVFARQMVFREVGKISSVIEDIGSERGSSATLEITRALALIGSRESWSSDAEAAAAAVVHCLLPYSLLVLAVSKKKSVAVIQKPVGGALHSFLAATVGKKLS
ncbi:hypothetical protein Cgig2_007612 [Carnegiea gigantea]|uniref:Uncharacterized protein n=1 Tax=Carnegiea gigantea TaxID=171969 RepID=A0A9Q1Q7E7_9CARY|nr:hypothetical protein Cgig2_007612 [Carnegiea gigantea]